jgi:hypothetical protein
MESNETKRNEMKLTFVWFVLCCDGQQQATTREHKGTRLTEANGSHPCIYTQNTY